MAGRRKGKQITHFAVRRRIEDIIGSEMTQVGRPLVVSGNDRPDGTKRREVIVQRAPTVNVRENLLRIQEEADPIGFLVAVQNGDLIPVTYVEDGGDVVTHYVQAGLDQRINVARFLANKVLPTLSVTKHVMATPDGNEEAPDAYDPARPGAPSFAKIVQDAALRRQQQVIMPVKEPVIVEVEDGAAEEASGGGGQAGRSGDWIERDNYDEPADGGDGALGREPG